MEITSELLKAISIRANEYAIAIRDEPDQLVLNGEHIEAQYITWFGGDRDVDTLYISCENLTEDLEEVYRKRQEEKIAKEIERELQREKERVRTEQIAKNDRYFQYLQLKREFEEEIKPKES